MKAVVRDVMSTHPISVRKNASFKEIAARLREYRVSAFPVLEYDGTVIGVVSEADMLAKEALGVEHHGLRGLIADIVHRTAFRKAAAVTAGDLEGTPETVPIGHKVLNQVRHVQGVVAVRDRLVYRLPSGSATSGPYL